MTTKAKTPAPRLRDRAATERKILAAAARLAARDGFAALGVNALAAEAGFDKKLIARYFGGIDGVVAALGRDTDLWLADVKAAKASDYGDLVAALLLAYAEKLRGDTLLQALLAWELVETSKTLKTLDASRSRAMQAWMAAQRGEFKPPANVDAPAINAVLLAAVNYLALCERTLGGFAGIDLNGPEGWHRIGDALKALLDGVHGRAKRPG